MGCVADLGTPPCGLAPALQVPALGNQQKQWGRSRLELGENLQLDRRVAHYPCSDVCVSACRCPAPGCEHAVEALVDLGAEPLDVACACGAAFCFQCKEEAHRPVRCPGRQAPSSLLCSFQQDSE